MASYVPLHWQQKVYDDLLRDEALGVIECVPYGEPVTWCHRMVINSKKFQFAEHSVNFAGFRVSDETIEPLPKYLDAIRDFPQPASTTDNKFLSME